MPAISAKEKLLNASLSLIREKGFSATTVDDLCARAGVTKGAFFHHFSSKEALGVAAAKHWSAVTGGLFAGASYHQLQDPVERVLAYIDLRKSLLRGNLAEFTCVAGTMLQEIYDSHPPIRDACASSIFNHAQTLVADLEQAMAQHQLRGNFTPQSLAVHTQAVLQGAFVLAKATGNVDVAVQSVDHLRRYFELLFLSPSPAPAKASS